MLFDYAKVVLIHLSLMSFITFQNAKIINPKDLSRVPWRILYEMSFTVYEVKIRHSILVSHHQITDVFPLLLWWVRIAEFVALTFGIGSPAVGI